MKASVGLGVPEEASLASDAFERRFALRIVTKLYQVSYRDVVKIME